jgi:MoxR-like ATPase
MNTDIDYNTLPNCWKEFYEVLAAGVNRVILYGPPGTGKTYAGLRVGTGNAGAYRVICSEEMTEANVVGHWMPSSSGAWSWNEGAVIQAWEGDGVRGGRVVADEIDKASGDVLSTLLAMFDSDESAEWKHPASGKIMRPREDFSVIMTTNLEQMRDLPTALKDRFPVAIRISTPHPDALKVLSPDLRSAAASSADADPARRFSIRAFHSFDKLRTGMGNERAAKIIFGKYAGDIIDAMRVSGVAS